MPRWIILIEIVAFAASRLLEISPVWWLFVVMCIIHPIVSAFGSLRTRQRMQNSLFIWGAAWFLCTLIDYTTAVCIVIYIRLRLDSTEELGTRALQPSHDQLLRPIADELPL